MVVADIAQADQPEIGDPAAGPQRFLLAVIRNRKATVGVLILVFIAFVAAFPGLVANHPPQASLYLPNQGPSSSHLLGTTQLGQDVFFQLVWATRLTLVVTLVVSVIATFISMIIGVSAAYLGGVTDRALTVLTDVFLIIPVLPLLILLSAYLSPSVTSLIIVLTATSWAFQARQLRSQGLSLRSRDFLVAARLREKGRCTSSWSRSSADDSLLAASFLALAVFEVGFAASLQFLGSGDSSELMWGTCFYNAQQAAALESGNVLWELAPGAAVRADGRRVRTPELRLRRDRKPGAATCAEKEAG